MLRLRTTRTILRPFEEQDCEEFFNMVQDERVKQYLTGMYCTCIQEASSHIDVYTKANFIDDMYFAITDKNTHKIIGCLLATRCIGKNVDIAYFITNDNRGKGIIPEVVKSYVNWLKSRKLKYNLLFNIDKANKSSLRVIEKLSSNIKVTYMGEDEFAKTYVIKT